MPDANVRLRTKKSHGKMIGNFRYPRIPTAPLYHRNKGLIEYPWLPYPIFREEHCIGRGWSRSTCLPPFALEPNL